MWTYLILMVIAAGLLPDLDAIDKYYIDRGITGSKSAIAYMVFLSIILAPLYIAVRIYDIRSSY